MNQVCEDSYFKNDREVDQVNQYYQKVLKNEIKSKNKKGDESQEESDTMLINFYEKGIVDDKK